MCCWPCILVIFDFVFHLNAPSVYFIFCIFLYMFRAILCSSSGGYFVCTQHLVLYISLFLDDRSVHRELEDCFSYFRAMVSEIIPCFAFFLIGLYVFCFLFIFRLSFWIKCFGKFFFMTCMFSHSFRFLSWLKSRESILFKYDLNAAIFCSIGWLEKKLFVVSVAVGFLYVSMLNLLCWSCIIRSRVL